MYYKNSFYTTGSILIPIILVMILWYMFPAETNEPIEIPFI